MPSTYRITSVLHKFDSDDTKSYFSSESDMNVVLRGTRFLLRMARTQPLASILDLRTKPDKTEAFFWPGDADPDLVSAPCGMSRRSLTP